VVPTQVRAGANVDHKDDDGDTALHVAVKDNWLAAIKALKEAKADASLKNNKDKSPREMMPNMPPAQKKAVLAALQRA